MANEVYANGREVSCKSGSGKSVAAFPDVCFTPPQTPATPPGVPLPYPNTGMTSDTTDGSKTVVISGKEAMLKNKSYFSKSSGDEAGCAPKKGVLTSVNRGKVYFNAWSMDVKIEGENAVRHLDITTHNHGSFPGNSPTWPFLDAQAFAGEGPCKEVAKEVKEKCLDRGIGSERVGTGAAIGVPKPSLIVTDAAGAVDRETSMKNICADDECRGAMKCVLGPYDPERTQPDGTKTRGNCCAGKTPHHLVPSADFIPHAERGKPKVAGKYHDGSAPCLCVEGSDHDKRDQPTGYLKEHGRVGRAYARLRKRFLKSAGRDKYTLNVACKLGAKSGAVITGCPEACLEEQLKKGHADQKMNTPGPDDPMPRKSPQKANVELFKPE
jgi:Domain of unknown function (DUF4150)/GHH signature containing HNH/Endo VII superfamily nuclease toxin  2